MSAINREDFLTHKVNYQLLTRAIWCTMKVLLYQYFITRSGNVGINMPFAGVHIFMDSIFLAGQEAILLVKSILKANYNQHNKADYKTNISKRKKMYLLVNTEVYWGLGKLYFLVLC